MHLADDWSQRIIEELNDLFRRILRILNEDMIPFAFFSTTLYQSLRSTISDANRMNSGIFDVLPDNIYYSLSIGDFSIGQQEYLFWISLNHFGSQYIS